MTQPAIGRIVHYVAYGTPGGEFPCTCRAVVITEVVDEWTVGLAVLNPTGMFFNRGVIRHPDDPADIAKGARCTSGERAYLGGTWHWPERVE